MAKKHRHGRFSLKEERELIQMAADSATLEEAAAAFRTTIETIERIKDLDLDPKMAHVAALNRIAIGFPIANIPVIPWTDHPGYTTAEGQELNETAIEAGDDPTRWYVSPEPVDVLQSTEIWSSSSILIPKLKRLDWYLKDVHNMVRKCREVGAYIPPTWLTKEEATSLSKRLNLPVISGSA